MFNIRPKTPDFGLFFLNTRVAIRSSALKGPVSVQEHWLAYGESAPLHRHVDEDEIFHILEGVIRFRVGDRESIGKAGDTLVGPKGVPHTFRVESRQGAHCLVITPGGDFEGLLRDMSRPALSETLPSPVEPTPEEQQRLAEAALRHRIEIIGPPMSAADECVRG